MKKVLRNFCLVCLVMTSVVSLSQAQERLTAIEYRNIRIAQNGESFNMDVWARAVEPGYTAAATPWQSFIIRIDLALVGQPSQPGATLQLGTPTVVSNGIAAASSVTNNPAGGFGTRLGFTLNRETGAELTASAQRLVTVSVPITGGTITTASVASTRQSPAQPGSTDSYWTSSVSSTTRRSLIIPTETPLPVKLASFKVTKEGDAVSQLNWVTTEEVNASHFDVERSADSGNWKVIGTEQSHGNSTANNVYNFTDATPLSGVNYYRLKMVDADGTFAHSTIQSVTMGEFTNRAVRVFPNPVSEVLYLSEENLASVKQVSLVTADGVTAYHANTVGSEGINVKNLTGGLYIVKLMHNDGSLSNHRVLISR
jgi:hypothetical protein